MALRKIIQIDGEGIVQTTGGPISLGHQKASIMVYCKITNIFATKKEGKVTIECVAENYKLVKQYDVMLSVDDGQPNFIKQAYEQIKTLPDWQGAIDC